MDKLRITRTQARSFLLYKHGLLGGYRFADKQGVLDYIRQTGCIQFDPIDICGRNADLVLQSRIKGYTKQMLEELLYADKNHRALVDYFDKNLSIFPVEDWKYFECFRKAHRSRERSHDKIEEVSEEIKQFIRRTGPVCSGDLDMKEKVDWYWSTTNLSRAALEHLYFAGELGVHHKKGTNKYYDLIENCLPPSSLSEPDPLTDDSEHRKWRALRRIGAVGLLWNRASDAWLCMEGFKTKERNECFEQLSREGRILWVSVEGIPWDLAMRTEDLDMMEYILSNPRLKKRCEFIAPLDCLLWDRKLISALFDFDYKWEIYTPKEQRRFGYYVLPIVFGNRFIGRLEAVCCRPEKKLEVRNIWLEDGIEYTGRLETMLNESLSRLARFNGMESFYRTSEPD